MPVGNRLGNVFGLFGNIDSNIGKSVVNPVSQASGAAVGGAQATGRLGQAQSFAGAEQARVQREQTARDSAYQQAQQYQQQIAQEAEAAQQRDMADRQQAFQEQEFRLQQAQFENQINLDSQRQAEEIRNNRAQAAHQLISQYGNNKPQRPNGYDPNRAHGLWNKPYVLPGSNFLQGQRQLAEQRAQRDAQMERYNRYADALEESGIGIYEGPLNTYYGI